VPSATALTTALTRSLSQKFLKGSLTRFIHQFPVIHSRFEKCDQTNEGAARNGLISHFSGARKRESREEPEGGLIATTDQLVANLNVSFLIPEFDITLCSLLLVALLPFPRHLSEICYDLYLFFLRPPRASRSIQEREREREGGKGLMQKSETHARHELFAAAAV